MGPRRGQKRCRALLCRVREFGFFVNPAILRCRVRESVGTANSMVGIPDIIRRKRVRKEEAEVKKCEASARKCADLGFQCAPGCEDKDDD